MRKHYLITINRQLNSQTAEHSTTQRICTLYRTCEMYVCYTQYCTDNPADQTHASAHSISANADCSRNHRAFTSTCLWPTHYTYLLPLCY